MDFDRALLSQSRQDIQLVERLMAREIDDVCPSKTSSDPYAEEDFFVPPQRTLRGLVHTYRRGV